MSSNIQYYVHPMDFDSPSVLLYIINRHRDDFASHPLILYVYSSRTNTWRSVIQRTGVYYEHDISVPQLSHDRKHIGYIRSLWRVDDVDRKIVDMSISTLQWPQHEDFWTRYTLLQELGRGATGIVFKIQDIQTHDFYALKLLRTVSEREISLLDSVSKQCPRIVGEFRICIVPNHNSLIMESLRFKWNSWIPAIQMEFIPGNDLFEFISLSDSGPDNDYTVPNPSMVYTFLNDLVLQLECVHQHGIVHRDIKPENIMIHENHARLIDFGAACIINESRAKVRCDGSPKGTFIYMAPELLLSYHFAKVPLPYDANMKPLFKSDIFGLGATFYTFVTGENIYPNLDDLPTFGQTMKVLVKNYTTAFYQDDSRLESLIRSMLDVDSERRPSIHHIKLILESMTGAPTVAFDTSIPS